MSRARSHYFQTLEKRMEYLASRIGHAEDSGKDLSYDKQELSALTWALENLHRIFDSAPAGPEEGE